MVDKNPITPEGAAKLRDELHNRKTVERPHITQLIAEARAHGDLSENAEYHAARERQGFNEARIKDLEDKLSRAEIIDPTKIGGDKVAFGATVKLMNSETEEEVCYRILGADEADINNGQISVTAPLARSLLGKEVGDEVKVRTPGGERVFEILEIDFTGKSAK
ncbi:Transcription elongation factor GreA [Labilithrix luteola]|uniref:Transcription elongation factor GreA n=1 Tax=Labilithrix luteola TaxID=1391654 RepID=A0A0K1Q9M0_9BACT|nr:transcription elongation factor GreA [Labilithrix luteola]AKV02357.1 Transcription elongation factor GreA [Labilithrix luteola]